MGSRRPMSSGIVVFEPKMLDGANLVANTAALTTSSYSEEGSRPGRVAYQQGATLVPVISGGQSAASVAVRVQRSGHPGRAAVTYSLDGGITPRGWQQPKVIGFEAITGLSVPLVTWDKHTTVTIPSTQQMVLCYSGSGGSTYARVRDPGSQVWSAAVEVTTSTPTQMALFVTPDERRLILAHIGTTDRLATYYSDDGGVTWDTLARAADIGVTLVATGYSDQASGAFIGNDMVLLVSAGGANHAQFASSDGGISWDTISDSFGLTQPRISQGPSGAVAAWSATVVGPAWDVTVAVLGSAYQLITEARTSVVSSITAGAVSDVHPVMDADGTIYVYIPIAITAGTTRRIIEFRSYDSATTWQFGGIVYNVVGSTAEPYVKLSFTAANGAMWLIGRFLSDTGTAGDQKYLVNIKLTAWSGVEWTGQPADTWLPYDLPDALTGWTAAGATAGLIQQNQLRIVTAASTGSYVYAGAAYSTTPGVHAIVKLTVGGALGSDDAVLGISGANATEQYGLRMRMVPGGFRLLDGVSLVAIEDVTIDMTERLEVLLAWTAKGKGYAAWKRPDDIEWTISLLAQSHVYADGGAVMSAWGARFGSLTSTTTDMWASMLVTYDDIGSVTSANNMLGKRIGGMPYPLPDVVDADGKVAHLSLRGGMGLPSEAYSVAPDYTYGLTRALPMVDPNPYRGWRSQDTAEQVIVWDLGAQSIIGGAPVLLIEQANFRYAYLEYYDGAAWQTVGQYDAATGMDGINYVLSGDVMAPAVGSAPGGRLMRDMEYARGAGGFAVLEGSPRYICRNNEARWVDDATTTRAVLQLEGITGTELATGACGIVSPGGLLICYPSTLIVARRWRVRVPSQVCPDAYFRAGIIAVGSLVPFGLGYAWGKQHDDRGQYESFTSRAGTETRTRTGQTKRSWTFDFSSGLPQYMPQTSLSPDYRGAAGGVKLAPAFTSMDQLRGVIERTAGQTIPVVAVDQLPTEATTITDYRRWLYGYPSASAAGSIASGREGYDEVERGESFTIDGITGD